METVDEKYEELLSKYFKLLKCKERGIKPFAYENNLCKTTLFDWKRRKRSPLLPVFMRYIDALGYEIDMVPKRDYSND